MEPAKHTARAAATAPGRNGRRTTRSETLAAIVDHCRSAKALADAGGDRFLAYMLAMTIEEAEGLIAAGPANAGRRTAP